MQSSFYLIALGISLSGIVIMCEHILKKYHSYKLHYTTTSKSTNQKKELPVAAMFVSESGLNEQSL
jgi:hypothetical protein